MKNKDGHLGIVVVGGTGDAPEADTSVEFLDLTIPGATWEKWPSLTTSRCCWPQVGGFCRCIQIFCSSLTRFSASYLRC